MALFYPVGNFYGILISLATWNSRKKNVSIAEGKLFHRREDINVLHQDLLSSLGMGEKVSRDFPTELWMRLDNSVRDRERRIKI